MSAARGLETLLFWLMALLGAAALVPCVVLPPWLEYQAELARRKAADAYVAEYEYRLNAVQKQIEHLHDDPAYLMRLAQQEFGKSIGMPPGESVLIGASPGDNGATEAAHTLADANAIPELLPEVSAFLEDALGRYPHARMFVDGRTRPVLMTVGAVLLLTAVVLLGRAGLDSRRGAE